MKSLLPFLLCALGAPALGGLAAVPCHAQEPHVVQKTRTLAPRVPWRKVFDKRFALVAAGILGSAAFDAETTVHCIHAHPQCREWNPVLGARPGRGRLYGVKFGIGAGQIWLLALYKRWDMRDDIITARWCEEKHEDANYDKYCRNRTHARTGAPRWWAVGVIPIGANAASGAYNAARSFPHTCPNGTVCK